MSHKFGKNNNKVYKIVLTGGPCGGKTTGQARLCSFFENLGWKVYRVPETASILLGGGVKFSDLGDDETYKFQENLLKTMMQIENTFFDLASACKQNCLVICDRGLMDASAYLRRDQWERMKIENSWNEVDLRDSRYNQVIHMVTAAIGAEECYSLETNNTRSEGVDFARELDDITSQAWVGHPYYDVVDNSTDFERKVVRMIATVCTRLAIKTGDRLALDARKHKYVVKYLPDDSHFLHSSPSTEGMTDEAGILINNVYPQYQDFVVIHDYLVTPKNRNQARLRRRGQNVKWDEDTQRWNIETGNWTYTHTLRKDKVDVELKMQISSREYKLLRQQRDIAHFTIYKKRRCFLWNNQYFQMDIYREPCHPRCKGLILLETYTASGSEHIKLPDFLDIEREVTGESEFSMYNLSLKEEPCMTNGFDTPSTPGKVRHVSGPTTKSQIPERQRSTSETQDRTRSTSVTEAVLRHTLGNGDTLDES